MHILTNTPCSYTREGLLTLMNADNDEHCVSFFHDLPEALQKLQLGYQSGVAHEGHVLLLAFPARRAEVQLQSYLFWLQWCALRGSRVFRDVTCLLWGKPTFKQQYNVLPVLEQELPPTILRSKIMHYSMQEVGDMTCCDIPQPQQSAHSHLREFNLSVRELSVLQYTLSGYTLQQIASILKLSYKTVWTHRRSGMDALGVRNLHGLIMSSPFIGLDGVGGLRPNTQPNNCNY